MAKKFLSFKKQIAEIEDIKETVKALEKISAANIHNLKIVSQQMEDYEIAIKKIFCRIEKEKIFHRFFNKPKTAKTLKVVLSTEGGFCGGILNQLFDFFQSDLKKDDQVLVIGEKGKKLCRERGIKFSWFFPGTKEIPKEEDIREIKEFIISLFLSKKFGQVLVFFPHFESLAVQRPKIFSFLPIDKKKFKEEIKIKEDVGEVLGYPIYEPSPREILDYLIKEYLGLVFYHKILETKLSELSARTIAMEEAGQKAKDLINRLFYQYLRVKRETITKEITDLYAHRSI